MPKEGDVADAVPDATTIALTRIWTAPVVAGVPLTSVETASWHCDVLCPVKGYTVVPPFALKLDENEYVG